MTLELVELRRQVPARALRASTSDGGGCHALALLLQQPSAGNGCVRLRGTCCRHPVRRMCSTMSCIVRPASLLLIKLRSAAIAAASASRCLTAASRSARAVAIASASCGSSVFIFFLSAMCCVNVECARAAAASAASDDDSASRRCAAASASSSAHEDLRADNSSSKRSLEAAASRDAF